ncbi:hypothetical protein OVA24_18280 [Luteolibacter sp. SL250]|uniref:hypothetical protein n=1 Tax=Luteolibacter sp. SL250 TaxID=2995170 RepID=UPI002270B1FC|nr:hypothetical protein [Luteolibacter sp. SL250]WAC19178.1 hypothetical protein OVA24_18280 [Luteolibacter sp. SL250]
MDLLVKGVIALLRKCVAAEAEETFRGREGGIAKALLILPLILLVIFAGVTCYVLSKPMDPARANDPAEVISGIILATVIPGLLLWMLVHFFTFRVSVAENVMTVSSLVTRRKQVRLDEPFEFFHDGENDKFRITQDGTVVRLGWIVNGYEEFLNLVWMKSRRWS